MPENTVVEIVKKYLVDNGYDGLYSEDYNCACTLDNFRWCGEYMGQCTPGYAQKTAGGIGPPIGPKRETKGGAAG